MKRVALKIDYDGTAYSGWQRQENALGIQQLVEEALWETTGEKNLLRCAGRTDAGVHAKGQVADFTTESTLPPERFLYPMNNLLPPDIRVMQSVEVPLDFSSRFDALHKHYRYTIFRGEVLPGRMSRFMTHYDRNLNLSLMEEGARRMVGRKDFKSFEGPYAQMATSIRNVLSVTLKEDGELLHFDIVGEAFLKNMVRIMVGTLIKMGEGRLSLEELEDLFLHPNRQKAGITMAAKGLTMMEVVYEDKIMKLFDKKNRA